MAVVQLVFLAACADLRDRIETVEETLKNSYQKADLTRLSDANMAVKEAGEAARAKIDALDVKGFNEAVDELHDAIRKVSERLGAVPTSDVSSVRNDIVVSATAVRRLLEEAHLDEAMRSFGQFAETLNRQAETLNLQQVLDESGLAIKELHAAVGNLDTNLQTTMIDIREFVQAATETVHEVDSALDSLRTTLGWASAVLILFGLCALVRLVRTVRTRPPSTAANK